MKCQVIKIQNNMSIEINMNYYGWNFVIKSKSEHSSDNVIQCKKCQSDIGNLNEKDVFFSNLASYNGFE